MSDLIKREDAIEALQKEINKGIPPFDDTMGAIRCGVRLARNIIEDLPSADRPQVNAELRADFLKRQYESALEEIKRLKADRPQGEWIDTAISIIDDMQREGIIDYEQAWEFRMRARMKGE